MHRHDAFRGGVVAASITLMFAAAPVAVAAVVPAATAPRDYAYHYFKERIPLDVETSMIAVYDAAAFDGVAAMRLDPLAAAGIPTDRVQASASPGWHYVELPDALRTRSAIEGFESSLSAPGAYDFVSPVFLGTGGLPVVMTRDVLVQLRSDLSPADRAAFISTHVPGQLLAADFSGLDGVYHVRTSTRTAAEVLSLVNALAARPEVIFAQSDAIWWADRFVVPNDPMFSQQWALSHAPDHDMNAPQAWDMTIGDPAVTVVVLDSGIDQAHDDIHQLPGQTFVAAGSGGPIGQCDNHGTAVAGCVAATIDNSKGVVGVAPGCTVRAAKIFNELFFIFICLPFLETQDSWTVNGITWAESIGARVTNSSWGSSTVSAAITTAFDQTAALGVMHFAAAGNSGEATITYPASLESVTAVAATNASGQKASFSQYGAGLFISAPGEGILTTDRLGAAGYGAGDTTTVDGTSFASPYTAGVAALVISMDPSLTPAEVLTIMGDTAKDRGAAGYDTTFGWGIVDAAAAVAAVNVRPPACPPDLNDDGVVDGNDLTIVLGAWGTTGTPGFTGDLNGDGIIDGSDLAVVLGGWGPCPK